MSKRSMNPVPTLNWVLKYQPIVSEILLQPGRFKRAESYLLADGKGPQHWIQVVYISTLLHLL